MTIDFFKYHGAGNDFIVLDNRNQKLSLTTTQIALLCHRRFGIGADGLMVLSLEEAYDFRMVYYNSDGIEGSMCGNGGRCIVAFAHYLNIIEKNTTFIAVDGVHKAIINQSSQKPYDISLEMTDVEKIEIRNKAYFMNTGSPHHISFVKQIEPLDVLNLGRKIRYSEDYASAGGTNVNFVEIKDDFLKIRTYERGVEDETLACGTGATATAIAYAHKTKRYNDEIILKALGGILRVKLDFTNGIFTNIILSGPAQQVFNGQWKL